MESGIQGGYQRSQGGPILSKKKRRGGRLATRFRTFNAFCDHYAEALKPTYAIVWVLLWRHADADGLVRMVSRNRLAKSSGLSARSVSRAITFMIEIGLVERVSGGVLGGRSSTYRMCALQPQRRDDS